MSISQDKANKRYRKKIINIAVLKTTHAKLKRLSILSNLPITQVIDALVDYYEANREMEKE